MRKSLDDSGETLDSLLRTLYTRGKERIRSKDRDLEVEVIVTGEPTIEEMEQAPDWSSELTWRGKNVMRRIGSDRITYFFDGIVEGSGIWFERLSWETASGSFMTVGKSQRSTAAVINQLIRAGMFKSEEDPNEGLWLYLTRKGAAVAQFLGVLNTWC